MSTALTTSRGVNPLRCSRCRTEVPAPGLCDACRARQAALSALTPEAAARRRAASLRRDRARREKVAAFGKLPSEVQARLLAEVRAERDAQ